jgi:hypothetical protein
MFKTFVTSLSGHASHVFHAYIYWLNISSTLNEAEMQSSAFYNKRIITGTFTLKIDTLYNTDIFRFHMFYRKHLRYGE